MGMQNFNFVALPFPEIIGGTRKNWAVHGYAHALFSLKFLMDFCSDGPSEYRLLEKFEIHSFSRS